MFCVDLFWALPHKRGGGKKVGRGVHSAVRCDIFLHVQRAHVGLFRACVCMDVLGEGKSNNVNAHTSFGKHRHRKH